MYNTVTKYQNIYFTTIGLDFFSIFFKEFYKHKIF